LYLDLFTYLLIYLLVSVTDDKNLNNVKSCISKVLSLVNASNSR